MGRNADNTTDPVIGNEPIKTRDKLSDWRLFDERGKSDRTYSSFEGDRMYSELDTDYLIDDRTDLNKLVFDTDSQRRLIDNKWW